MSPKLFKKSTRLDLEELASAETSSLEKKVAPEPREILPGKEQEYPKKEVLEELQEVEKPVKKRPVLKPTEPVQPQPAVKSPVLLKIEGILEEDLQDAYFKMEPELQQKFKIKGEEIATKVEKVLQKTKVKAKKIFKLIFGWLKIIPGINKFFIKQEAKIKTDKIIKLKQNK